MKIDGLYMRKDLSAFSAQNASKSNGGLVDVASLGRRARHVSRAQVQPVQAAATNGQSAQSDRERAAATQRQDREYPGPGPVSADHF